MTYMALIADIVSSRSIPKRGTYQKELIGTLGEINAQAQDALASPYTVTLGDEFQALYQDARPILRDILAIVAWSRPRRIRFALAYDTISTEVNRTQSIGMDGPAFVAARELLTRLKEEQRTIVQVAVPVTDRVTVINYALRSLCHLLDLWHPHAVTVLHGLLRGARPPEIARETGISLGTTYKHIREKYLHDYVGMIEEFGRQLARETTEHALV